ncbi:MAG: hypothetical protein IKZ48_08885 [Prevotella sp.]|nr:hypothetical protein [Prevotella sp.]
MDCCSAEEALQVYNFLKTVKIIPELSTTVDGKYDVFAYSRNGSFHTGYNEIFFVATKKKNGNYIKNFDVTSVTPLMLMVKMNMKHSTPVVRRSPLAPSSCGSSSPSSPPSAMPVSPWAASS